MDYYITNEVFFKGTAMGISLDKFVRNLRRGVGESFAKKKMRAVGELAIELIVKRTRNGFGLRKTGGTNKRLKKLATSTKNYRKANRSKLDSTTSPGKSNLTFTGKMLRSMVVKEVKNRKVTWGPNKRMRKDGLTNEELGKIVADNGRPFNYLSKTEIKKMITLMDKQLKKEINKI